MAGNFDSTRPFDATRPWLNHQPQIPLGTTEASFSLDHAVEQWPVKVTLHLIDLESMTLAGTMEAYDVPSPGSSSTTSPLPASSDTSSARKKRKGHPITTYLEGHILDFRTYTFQTPRKASSGTDGPTSPSTASAQPSASSGITFPETTVSTDASNWRRLPPFSAIKDDDEVARMMLSQSQMKSINEDYIFMRWKERCFIHTKEDRCAHRSTTCPENSSATSSSQSSHAQSQSHTAVRVNVPVGEGDDTDTGHGLTISGFYYVSLRRDDGVVRGLYFDPCTKPYQCLKLSARNGGVVGSWAFR